MNAPSTLSDPRAARPLIRFLFPAICILGAFSTALFTQKPTKALPPSVSHEPNISPLSPTAALDQLPVPDINSNSTKILAASLLKIHTSPNEARNWIQAGNAFAQLQRETEDSCYFDAAEAVYTEALRLAPKSVDALAGMAWVTGGRHQFDKSIAWGNQALAEDPQCVEAYGIVGDAAVELGDYELAFGNYQKMMDLRPDLSSWSRGAHLLWLTGETNKAMMLMGKAIAAGAPFAENTAWCQIRMATMLFHKGAILPAEDAIRPLLEAGSRNSHLLLLAARIATAKGDFPLAENIYRKMLESGPNQQAYAGLGDLMSASGRAVDAEKNYQIVENLHSNHLKNGVHDHGFMAKFMADNNRNLVEALRMVEEHKLTKNVQEADTLAWVYYKNNMLPQAINAMKTALSRNTPDPEIHYHAGMIASAYGDHSSAKKHLKRALAMNPYFSVIQAPLALKELEQLEQRKSITQADPANH
ncbi:MAG: tetratricopeptide repeat protein [Gloeobacteraceae cyanobacterium ES-bin-144]|nr:tetratricopeptide repeat protein [Verrucomicrobiales bacterium]